MESRKLINLSDISKQRLALVFLWVVIAIGFFAVRSIILPFILASLLAYVIHPAVRFLGKIKIKGRPLPKALSVLIIYLLFIGAISLICLFFIPQFYLEMVRLAKEITTFINSLDENSISKLGEDLEEFFRTYQLPLEIVAPIHNSDQLHKMPSKNLISIDLVKTYQTLLNDTLSYLKSEAKNILSSAQHFFAQFISAVFMSMLVIMITGFLLVDAEVIKQFIFSLVPITDRKSFDNFLVRLDKRLSGVVRGQLTICLINAVLTLIGLLIFQVKFAFILATLAGVFSLVPIFGSIASTIPIVLVALTISPLTALCASLWIAGIHLLEANFLNPKVMGNSAKIHPVLIILALLAGEHFYGIIGALLAVPIISIIITIFVSILSKARQMDEGVANPGGFDTIHTKEV